MTCFIAKNLLSELIDDALEPARARELQQHVDGCAECARELAELKRVRSLLRAMPREKAPVDFFAKVNAKAQYQSPLERVSSALSAVWKLPAPAKAGVAFAASLVLVITVWFNGAERRGAWDLAQSPAVARKSAPQAPAEATGADREEAPAPTAVAALDAAAGPDEKQGQLSNVVASKNDAAKGQLSFDDSEGGYKAGGKSLASATPAMAQARAAATPPPPPPAPLQKDADLSRSNKKEAPASLAMHATPAPTIAAQGGLSWADPSAAAGRGASGSGMSGGGSSAGVVATTAAPKVEMKATKAPADTRRMSAAPGAAAPSADRDAMSAAPANEPAVSESAAMEPAYESHVSGGASSGSTAGDDWGGATAGETVGKLADKTAEKAKKRNADEVSSTATAEAPAPAKPSGSASSPLPARFLTDSPTGPAEVIAAAKEAGGSSITVNPPTLGRSGGSTVVVVDIPAGAWDGFVSKLEGKGSMELSGEAPARRARVRIEVVKR